MMTQVKYVMSALIFATVFQIQSLSSSEPSNPAMFLEMNGDKMKFKELMDFALVNQAQKQAVVHYFQQRFNKLKNTQCPVLSAAWLKAGSGRNFGIGLPSLVEGHRWPGDYTYVAPINNLKWRVITGPFSIHTAE